MTYHIRTYADGVRITLRRMPGRIEIEAAQGDKFGGFAELRDGETEIRLQNTGVTDRVIAHMRGAARRFRHASDAIVAEARRDAATFADEFPGEVLDPAATDWDATAWGLVPAALRNLEGGFEIYQGALVAETRRLAREVRS